MRFRIISVGRKRADAASPLVDEYLSRISKFFPIDDVVIKPGPPLKVTERMQREVEKSDLAIALDEGGKMYSSDGFAEVVNSWMTKGYSEITFLIGGAEGLPSNLKKEVDFMVSLSSMTFPHRLARLFLAEQIYRALCIIRNIPYNK